jgi:Fic family protein
MQHTPSYEKVRDALVDLSSRFIVPGPFRTYFTAAQVAEQAGVSESTARKYLKELVNYRFFEQKSIAGVTAYRYYVPSWQTR